MAYVGKVPLTGAYQILDDISGSFTGSTAGPFNLTVSGTAVSPETEASVIISVSGVVQQPVSAFTISGSQIRSQETLQAQILFLVLFLVILLTSENQLMQQ